MGDQPDDPIHVRIRLPQQLEQRRQQLRRRRQVLDAVDVVV
jgi:hypothetical protein